MIMIGQFINFFWILETNLISINYNILLIYLLYILIFITRKFNYIYIYYFFKELIYGIFYNKNFNYKR